MIKICVICGMEFKSPPSDKKVTCSKECQSERARRINTGRHVGWGKEARERQSARGHTDNLKLGTAAAQASPKSGPFETNQNALSWTLLSPEGVTFTFRNLSLWLREHADMLPGTSEQARAGIVQMKRSMLGRTKRPVTQWKGWRLIGWEK